MKKTAAFLMALLLTAGCLFALAGCGKRCTAADLSAYLDEEGFVAGLCQTDLEAVVKRYTGIKDPEEYRCNDQCDPGWRIFSDRYRFSLTYYENVDENTGTVNLNLAASTVPGLSLPCGIRFSDTASKMLKRLSLDFDLKKDFDSDYVVLWKEEGKRIVASKTNGCVIPEDGIGGFRIQYVEAIPIVQPDGSERTVRRTLSFLFDSTESKLGLFSMSITEDLGVSETDASAQTPSVLSAYLDEQGFVAGMSQAELIAKAEEIEGGELIGMHWDGVNGGGWQATCGWQNGGTIAYYENDYRAYEEEKYAVYSNKVTVIAESEGLNSPAGIRFSDTLPDVLKKLSVEGDPINVFTPDPGRTDVMTLFAEGNVTLKLSRVTDLGTPTRLEFVETSTRTLDDGRVDTVVRRITFSFADGNGTLNNYMISVTERYPLKENAAE